MLAISIPKTHEQGFSLLEVLVSIVILSLGVLGVVGMQASSLQANREVRVQADGLRFADELAELMRGNKQISIQLTPSDNPYLISSLDNLKDPGCGLPTSTAASCDSTYKVAQRDVFEWAARVKSVHPERDSVPPGENIGGKRVVVCEDATPYDANGLPQWSCSGTGGILILKMGWTKSSTLRGATGDDATDTSSSNMGAFDKALRPSIVLSITPGSSS